MATATPQALTVPEVMAALRMSRSKVYDLLRSGTIPSFREGRLRRIDAEDLATYLHTRNRSYTP
ncbi:helix-turn-helix domain-containing protein [Kitasatospora sp. NPDC058965]|uniref:helix-turn-helix domain-containing protein n=1 Tax=Kitasatospora sp. NPDC058965 TaxID=3346682 RepID=UPI0036B85157